MQEKERVASEEAEKRLKAALTAKREPNATVSRVASPNPGAEHAVNGNGDTAGEAKAAVTESQSGDVVMESAEEKSATAPEVRCARCRRLLGQRVTGRLQSPWLPELAALFDDVRKIAPGNAAEVIGYVDIHFDRSSVVQLIDIAIGLLST